MSLALQLQPSCWYKTLVSEVEINTVPGAINSACTIMVVGSLVNIGIILAVAPIATTTGTQDAMHIEAIVQAMPIQVTDKEWIDLQDDRIDAIRPRHSLIGR